VFRRHGTVNASDIETVGELRPPLDPVFDHLIEAALAGRVPVYFGAVPRAYIRPFDPSFAATKHPVSDAAISDVHVRWQRGELTPIWIYPTSNGFIMSDDYVVWEAIKKGEPDFVPCWILGPPNHPGVTNLRGPIDQSAVKRALGFSSESTSEPAAVENPADGKGLASTGFVDLRRKWKSGRIAIGIDRAFARRFYTDVAISEIHRRTGERDLLARMIIFGAFLLAPAALFLACVLAVIALKWASALAIPIAVLSYAAYQGSSSAPRSRLMPITWLLTLSVVGLILNGNRERLAAEMISAFLFSLWATRFMYVTAVRSLRSLVLRNARAYDWLQDQVTLNPT
jgi:hypothetical protein